jgi:hypothetical protein
VLLANGFPMADFLIDTVADLLRAWLGSTVASLLFDSIGFCSLTTFLFDSLILFTFNEACDISKRAGEC